MSIDKLKTKFFTGAWLTDVKHYFTKINEIIDYLNGIGKSGDGSYKVYTALLTQNGTSAPSAIVLQNTLGTITFGYEDIGAYSVNSDNLFNSKTAVFIQSSDANQPGTEIAIRTEGDTSLFEIFTYSSGVSSNLVMNLTTLEIRVYN